LKTNVPLSRVLSRICSRITINVAGLGAEEHLAAIHADQFHRLLRADSFDDFQDM